MIVISQGNGFSRTNLLQDDLAFTRFALTSTNCAYSLHHTISNCCPCVGLRIIFLWPQHWVWVFRDSLFFRDKPLIFGRASLTKRIFKTKKRWKLLVDCFPYSKKQTEKQTSLEETTNDLVSIRGICRSRWWFHISLFYLFVKVEVHESQFQRLAHMFWNRMA